MTEKHAAVDRALGLDPESLKRPAVEVVVGAGAREAAMTDTIDPRLPGDRYDEGRNTALDEFVVLQLGCGRKTRLDQLPTFRTYDKSGETFPPIRLINLDDMAVPGAHIRATLGRDPIPLPDDSVNLIYASHVLEHIGRQGELDEWFFFWGEAYRVLKPGGRVQFISPYYTSVWCWADPTHSRAISEQVFLYLCQDAYRVPPEQTAIPLYRPPCDFVPERFTMCADGTNPNIRSREPGGSHLAGVLVARKPFRPYWEDR